MVSVNNKNIFGIVLNIYEFNLANFWHNIIILLCGIGYSVFWVPAVLVCVYRELFFSTFIVNKVKLRNKIKRQKQDYILIVTVFCLCH